MPPHRQVATFRGTRRPHDGQTLLKPDKSRSGMSHNKGLVERIKESESIYNLARRSHWGRSVGTTRLKSRIEKPLDRR